MATRRKLDDALDYGRQLQSVHELQDGGASASLEDIVAILDVSEVDADAQPKKITLQELVNAGGGGSATPAGNAGEIQINDGADPPNLGAVTDFKWDSVDGALDVPGDINLDDGGTYSTTLQTITPTADRVISFPDATGTVGLVAGSSGQLIYNNAGANAGTPTLTYDGSILTSSGRFINSYNATASSPAKAFTGTWFTGGTATTTKPQVLIEPTGTTSTAWSTSGTGLGVNAASGFAGNLLDLQVNGTSTFRVNNSGVLDFGGAATSSRVDGTASAIVFSTNNNAGGITARLSIPNLPEIRLVNGASIGFAAGTSSSDVSIFRDAANTLAQRNGTNAQTLRVYGTYTDLSNHVRGSLSATSTAVTLAAETAGTGADDIPLNLTAAGTGTVKVNSNLEVADAKDVVLGTTTGTKIGTATTQKLGFYNATPVVQPTAVANITTTATSGSLPTPDGTVTIADATTPTVTELLEYCVELEAKLEAALGHLRTLGLIAT